MEVFKQILELLDTMAEAFGQTDSNISEGKDDEALEMVYDILSGINSIMNVLAQVKEQFSDNNLQVLETEMIGKFNKFTEVYRSQDRDYIRNYLVSDLMPGFMEWKKEIERLLTPLVLS